MPQESSSYATYLTLSKLGGPITSHSAMESVTQRGQVSCWKSHSFQAGLTTLLSCLLSAGALRPLGTPTSPVSRLGKQGYAQCLAYKTAINIRHYSTFCHPKRAPLPRREGVLGCRRHETCFDEIQEWVLAEGWGTRQKGPRRAEGFVERNPT